MTFANRVAWTIEPRNSALLIHDMQPHYLSAVGGGAVEPMIHNVARIISACREANAPIFVSRVHPGDDPKERGLMLDMWGAGPARGLDGLAAGLKLVEGGFREIRKRSYSVFFASDFEVVLWRLGKSSLIVTGVYTSIGCAASAMDAFMRDIKAFAVVDATADFTPEDHAGGLRRMALTCAKIVQTDEVLDAFAFPNDHAVEEMR